MSPAYLIFHILALEIFVTLLEHLTRQLQVALNHLWLPLLVPVVAFLILVLALVPRKLDWLRFKSRIRDPDLPVPACHSEPLVQRTRAGTLTLLHLKVDVCLPEELRHREWSL